jgi:hypothetical protein
LFAVVGLYFASTSFIPAFSFTGLGDYLSSFYSDYYELDQDAIPFHPDGDSGGESSTLSDQENSAQNSKTDSDRRFERFDVNDPEYAEFLTNFKYVLYYGGFDSRVAEAILAVKPTLLITNYESISSELREDFARNNISVIAYLPIHWTDRSLDSTLEQARSLLDSGADGIFVDEATTVSSDWDYWYHGKIYEAVKEFDENAVVIINPGTGSVSERAMEVSDIICFEHEWRDIANLGWASDYPGWRFMGISSNEFVKVMGYHVGAGTARDDLDEARSLNIAYHYSADHYIWLPPWLDAYGGSALSIHPVSEYDRLDLPSVTRPAAPTSVEEREEDPPRIDPEEQEQHDDPPSANDTADEPERSGDEPPESEDNGEQSDDSPPSANEPPRARAGEDQDIVLEAEDPISVYLDGQTSDPDSEDDGGLSFQWQQTGGPEVSLIDADSSSASFVLDPSLLGDSSSTQLRFKLTVTDSDGAMDTDRLGVHVSFKEPEPDDAQDNDDSDASNVTDTEEDPKIDQESDTSSNHTRSSEQEANATASKEPDDVPAKDEQSDNSTETSVE